MIKASVVLRKNQIDLWLCSSYVVDVRYEVPVLRKGTIWNSKSKLFEFCSQQDIVGKDYSDDVSISSELYGVIMDSICQCLRFTVESSSDYSEVGANSGLQYEVL